MVSPLSAATGQALPDIAARLAALHQRRADGIDPVRLCLIEAMARRAEKQADPVRRQLDARLAVLLAELEKAPSRATVAATPPDTAAEPAAPPPGSLASLLAYIAAHDTDHGAPDQAESPRSGAGKAPDLKALSQYRSEWARLGVEQQITEALAQVPDNAGPLNSQRLVVQALARMHELSPEFLGRFLGYANTLLWLEQADSARAAAQKTASDGEKRPVKSPRGKARTA